MPRIRAALRAASPLLFAAPWLACTKDEPVLLDPPSLSHEGGHTIFGRLVGPDGTNICRTIEEGTMLVRLLNPEYGRTSDVPYLGEQDLTCPDNRYSFPVDEGTANLRVELPLNPNLGALPWRNLDQVPVGPDDGVFHNVRISNGTALGGRARLDGRPLEGVFFDMSYDFNPNFGATSGSSGPDGRWMEFFGRLPMILQNDRRYIVLFSNCDAMLGTRQLVGFPEEGFMFPSGRPGLNCNLETARSTRFSHTFTRLAVTPMPGEIGGWFGSALADRFGTGWGVQFPVEPGSSPAHASAEISHLFRGGLLIGIRPDVVLTGVSVEGSMECGASCHDLGLDGTVEFTPQAEGEKRRVIWRYSDATSGEGVGLRVVQASIDGARSHDYVLFRFSIRNTSQSRLTFHAGFVGDWDIDLDAGHNNGFTALNGRLMYQTSQDGTGNHVGTMLLGEAPVTGNYFFPLSEFPSLVDQVRAVDGRLRRRTAGPGDLANIHGAGPITLDQQETQDVWVAVVAGQSRAQLLANAEAARADVAGRMRESIAADASMITVNPAPVRRAASRSLSPPLCKDCKSRY
jgi:hypothetical protein